MRKYLCVESFFFSTTLDEEYTYFYKRWTFEFIKRTAYSRSLGLHYQVESSWTAYYCLKSKEKSFHENFYGLYPLFKRDETFSTILKKQIASVEEKALSSYIVINIKLYDDNVKSHLPKMFLSHCSTYQRTFIFIVLDKCFRKIRKFEIRFSTKFNCFENNLPNYFNILSAI